MCYYATLRRALSTRFFGRNNLDFASWLGVAGLRAKDKSKPPPLPLADTSRKEGIVTLCPLLLGDELFFLQVPDCKEIKLS